MSDKDKPQLEESPLERLLREALDARAQQVTAQSLRPAAPPKTRIRRLRPVVTAAIPLFGLAAGVLGYFTFNGAPTAMHREQPPAATVSASPTPSATPSHSASPTDSPSASPSPSASVSDSPSGTTSSPSAVQQQLNGVKFSLPAGWTLRPISSWESCLMSPGAPVNPTATTSGCFPYGVELAVYTTPDEIANATWPTDGDLDSPSGWSHQPYCPVWGNPHLISQAETDTYKATGSPQRTTVAVNGHYAGKTQWQVACNANEQFTAQMWGFHKEQVFVAADGLKGDYQHDLDSIVSSLDLSGHADPQSKGHGNDIKVAVTWPAADNQVPNNGTALNFSVTWTNVSSTSYSAVDPVVATDHYSGGDPVMGMADGTLERQDGTSWTKLPSLSVGGGMDYATTGKAAAFALAPGESRTINYRMSVTSKSGPGQLPLLAQTFVPTADNPIGTKVGENKLLLQVVAKP